jgi:two-component system sensor kinase FixL
MPLNLTDEAIGILAALTESSDDAVVIADSEGIIQALNGGAERLYGFAPDELVGRPLSLLIPQHHWDELGTTLASVRAGQRVERHETVRRARDGRDVDVLLAVSPVRDASGQVIGLVSVATDISEHKRGERALHASEGRWRAILDSAVDAMIVIDDRGRIEAFNPAAERLFGHRESEVLGQNVAMLMPAPYRDEHDGYIARYLATGVRRIIGIGREVTGLRRDGTTFPLHLSVGEMSIGGERKFTGILHDLSERVRLEERLRTSEARWRSIVESAVDGIVVIDTRGRIEAFNPAAERLFGYAEAEVLGRNVNVLMPEPYHSEHDGYLARYLATGIPRIIGVGREATGRRRDGSTFPLRLSVGEVSFGGERRFTGILHDLSERVRLEEQLREQAAMARLGEMAAVVAHEVRNPLAGVRGAIQVIGGRLPADSRDAAVIKEVVARIDSLNEMMNDLLLFARPPKPRPAPVDVKSLVAATADILKEDPALNGVRVDVEGMVPRILADGGLLRVVFLNLLVNGAHAMEGRGRIRVSLSSSGGSCLIAFSDHGPGIPPEIREKIFTPFFTTKAKGTGLGLPTAKRFVEAHLGSITIDCPPAGGTTVSVQIPIAQ